MIQRFFGADGDNAHNKSYHSRFFREYSVPGLINILCGVFKKADAGENNGEPHQKGNSRFNTAMPVCVVTVGRFGYEFQRDDHSDVSYEIGQRVDRVGNHSA
ncbi:hypothetical protein ES708_31480 [subsurface metagenome]